MNIVELLLDMDGLPMPALQDKVAVLSFIKVFNKSGIKFFKQRILRVI